MCKISRAIITSLFCLCAILPSSKDATLWALTYYVGPTSCNDGGTGTNPNNPWCTIGQANNTLVAGDIVYIRTGTYSDAIRPANNGISDTQRITYQAYGDGDVTLTGFTGFGTEYGAINLATKSYVSVIGRADSEQLSVRHFIIQPFVTDGSSTVNQLISFCGGTGNVVENVQAACTSSRSCNYGVNFCIHSFGSQLLSRYNVIRRSHITGNSHVSVQDGVEDLVNLGGTPQFNLLEDNIFDGAVRHITFNNQATLGSFNVSRGNAVTNLAHTAQSIYDAGPNHLVENSRLQGHAAPSTCVGPECNFGSSFQVGTTNLLFRYNTLFEGCRAPCNFDSQGGFAGGFGGDNTQAITNHRLYNNTIVDSAGVPFGLAEFVGDGTHIRNGIMVNNFFYDGNAGFNPGQVVVYRDTIVNVNDRFIRNVLGNPGGTPSQIIIQSNTGFLYTLAGAIAALTNPSEPEFTAWNGFQNVYDAAPGFTNYAGNDFTLLPSSPYVDTGSPLTRVAATDTGAGTSLVLDDARFFYDTSGFPVWMGVQWDWIAVGSNASNITSATKVQLAGINYATNTVTLTTPISRNIGNFVWLWKDSSGREVVAGTAPDIGASEVLAAPAARRVIITKDMEP